MEPLAGLPVECRNPTPDLLAEMRGPQKFAHRIKVAIIEQMYQDNPGDEVIYCDSDTFFVMPVAPLWGCCAQAQLYARARVPLVAGDAHLDCPYAAASGEER